CASRSSSFHERETVRKAAIPDPGRPVSGGPVRLRLAAGWPPMDAVLSAGAIFAALLVVLRIGGKRTLSQTTTFDFVMLLISAETTPPALLGDDCSVTNALLVSATLVGLDIGLSLVKRRWPKLDRFVDGIPMVIVANGKPLL